MFVDYPNFADSLGMIFLINWFIALQCKTIHLFVISSCGRKFGGKSNPPNPGIFILQEQ